MVTNVQNESEEESSSGSDSEEEAFKSIAAKVDNKLDNLTPEERKKMKNKLKRKRQAEKKKKAKVAKPSEDMFSDVNTENGKEKKLKKFYDIENEQNKEKFQAD